MSGEAGDRPRLLVLLGPTGTGKSTTAVAVARRIGGEIIGCDSLQLYRGFDAATAKPEKEALGQIPHHLIDCVDPRTAISVADYVLMAEHAIAEVARRAAVPMIVGGTGMYLRGVLRGLIEAPVRDRRLRERLESILKRGGEERLRRVLLLRDPESAIRIAPGDTRRLARAIEVARAGGANWSERIRREGTWSGTPERFASVKVGLDMDRTRLAARLDARVDRFFEAGLVAEVQALLRSGVPREANAFKAIGYREVLAALDRGGDSAEVRAAIRRNTRRYSKRQRTWFRSEPDVLWLDAERFDDNVERIVHLWRGARGS